ncbi:hypothetical protein G6F37_010518 [Rhizopus arrhizus]|nr:hypothetical protein G6F38_009906 [Rhizopus arrhizus]KAG1153260.1 hypothetical protein G6F37_010518 [Rhizopus arrhizus]
MKITKRSNQQNTKSKFKSAIATLLSDTVSVEKQKLLDLIQIPKSTTHGQFTLPIPQLLKLVPHQDKDVLCKEIVHLEEYIRETLLNVFEEKERYGHTLNDRSVLIHLGSPAKHHEGHLKRMILGGFIQRIYEANGYKCYKLNDLGDEKNLYALLAVGYKKYGNSEEKDTVRHLDDISVKINQDMKQDLKKVTQEVSDYLRKLDQGDPETVQEWQKLRLLIRQSSEETHRRLLKDQRFEYMNDTEDYIPMVYRRLEEKGLCNQSEDGSLVVNLSDYNLGRAVIRTPDESSTCLTREIAGVLMYCEKYKDVEKIIYVASVEQENHCKQLFKILQIISDCPELVHIPFGKILNMSTLSLKEILDTAKENMLRVIKEDMRHGKYADILKEGIVVDEQLIQGEKAVDYIADTLGISGIITQDMANKRVRNYHFAWDRMTDARGDTGIFLQYTHTRICGIERKLNFPVSPHCQFSLLNEEEAFELTRAISLYPDIIQTTFQSLDSSTLVLYLFKLAHMISQVNYNLRIKDVDPKLAEARLLLFWAAKTTLANGMKLIGLHPLERM